MIRRRTRRERRATCSRVVASRRSKVLAGSKSRKSMTRRPTTTAPPPSAAVPARAPQASRPRASRPVRALDRR